MRRAFIIAVIFILSTAAATGSEYRFSLGAHGGFLVARGGDVLRFDPDLAYGGSLGIRLGSRWQFVADLTMSKLSNDTTKLTAPAFGSINSRTPVDFKITRIGGMVYRWLKTPQHRTNIALGAGGGIAIWKLVDPVADTTYKVEGVHGQTVDFSASELFFTAGMRFVVRPLDRLSFELEVHGDYLTGAGAEFESSANKARDRWLASSLLSLHLHFSSLEKKEAWPSDSAWQSAPPPKQQATITRTDSDGDGVPDDFDKCPGTQRGAVVDAGGCAIDSDNDGVPDGLDDCPGTPTAALGKVDVDGCPIDADFDGIPDYGDKCPNNPVGAKVDSIGCPIDGDGDGVPDGLDDCPNTLPGIAVDKRGCIDMTMFAQPMVLNIEYDPGGFEVDTRNKARLQQLARVLAFVPDLKLEVNAYTDDIGADAANQKLSEKRAYRVREFLVAYGVSPDRIKAFGRGKGSFVASNQTAEGRAKNRRVEIVFYK